VIVLTEDALAAFVAEIQKGFTDLNTRLDAMDERIAKPGLASARQRQQLATDALKAVTSRPPVKRRPRKQV
jgi:hypothetical protein